MSRLAGILLVILSAATFGSLAIFGRYAYAAGLDVTGLLFLRFTLEPVVTVLLAAALLGEQLAPASLLGGGLILGAVVLLTLPLSTNRYAASRTPGSSR